MLMSTDIEKVWNSLIYNIKIDVSLNKQVGVLAIYELLLSHSI